MKGKTESGFEFDVNVDELTELVGDYEFLEAYAKVDSGDIGAMITIVNGIMSACEGDALAHLKEHVRTENGHVPAVALVNEADEIVTFATSASDDLKN